MWKFVSRRIRDSVERTYNVLEHHRTWTCGGGEKSGGGANALSTQQDEAAGEAAVVLAEKLSLSVIPFRHENGRNQGSSSSSSSSEDDFRRQGCEQTFVGAITWSSAIVCGWYASQMLCMRRRHLKQDGWSASRCRFSRGLMLPGQAFHSNLLSHWVLTAPIDQNRRVAKGWIGRSLLVNDSVSLCSKVAELYPVNNEEVNVKKAIEVRRFGSHYEHLKNINLFHNSNRSRLTPQNPRSTTQCRTF